MANREVADKTPPWKGGGLSGTTLYAISHLGDYCVERVNLKTIIVDPIIVYVFQLSTKHCRTLYNLRFVLTSLIFRHPHTVPTN